jgi:regulator of replication initiation timing
MSRWNAVDEAAALREKVQELQAENERLKSDNAHLATLLNTYRDGHEAYHAGRRTAPTGRIDLMEQMSRDMVP